MKLEVLLMGVAIVGMVWAPLAPAVIAEETETVQSAEKPDSTQLAKRKYKKIEVRDNWLFGLQYKAGGKKMGAYDAEALMQSIGDTEVTTHLETAQAYSIAGVVMGAAGTVLSLYALPMEHREFNPTLFWIGLGVEGVGSGLIGASKRETFNAVDRYNDVLEEKFGISMYLEPLSGKGMLQLSGRFR
jgi:hypothetical protein